MTTAQNATPVIAEANEAGSTFGLRPHKYTTDALREAMPRDPATAMQFVAAAMATYYSTRPHDRAGIDALCNRLTAALLAQKAVASSGGMLDRKLHNTGPLLTLGVTTSDGSLLRLSLRLSVR